MEAKTKKIGIVTCFNIFNYGSFLQAYALQKTLEVRGYSALFLSIKGYGKMGKIILKTKKILKIFIRLLRWPKYLESFLKLRKMGRNQVGCLPLVTKTKMERAVCENLNIETDSLLAYKKKST